MRQGYRGTIYCKSREGDGTKLRTIHTISSSKSQQLSRPLQNIIQGHKKDDSTIIGYARQSQSSINNGALQDNLNKVIGCLRERAQEPSKSKSRQCNRVTG